MSVAPDDVLDVTVRAEFDGVEDIVNNFQVQYQNTASASESGVINDVINMFTAIYNVLIAIQNAVVVYRDIRIANKTQDVLLGTFPITTFDTPDGTANPLPPGNCGLITFGTNIPRVTLRKYLGGHGVGAIDSDGKLTTVVQTAIGNFGTALMTPYTGSAGTYEYGYDSPKTGGFVVPNSALTTDVVAYQRRRKEGRGS